MREIKFRAWLPGISKMTYLHTLDELTNWNTKPEDNGSEIWLQYTGQKDKNGKEIYDQDILRDQYEDLYTVIYEYGCFKLLWNHKTEIKQTFYNDEFSECILEQSQYEVIGNIYQNSDLLK